MSRLRHMMIMLALVAVTGTTAYGIGPLESALRSEIRMLPAPDDASGSGQERMMSTPSPRNAFLMSLAIPGLGQFYASGWDPVSLTSARGVGYLAFEAVGWMQYDDNRDKGWDKQVEYRAYADANWHWKENPCLVPTTFRDSLPEPDLQTEADFLEFYEDIHKLPKWICGWDDYPTDVFISEAGVEETPMRAFYSELRREQNDLLTKSRRWKTAIIFNHIVSAFDAYFTARTQGNGEGFGLRLEDPTNGVGGAFAFAYQF
ncbi:MAG: hypothetical protein HKN20_15935 [Gemmatimonadetes bacterium]|nr:hypothetical protein [Gemmatimonadota bacterium]